MIFGGLREPWHYQQRFELLLTTQFGPARSRRRPRGLVACCCGPRGGLGPSRLFREGVPNRAGGSLLSELRREPPDHGFDANVQPVREGRKEIAMTEERPASGAPESSMGASGHSPRMGRQFYKTAARHTSCSSP
jgi:hypothetical protein